MRLATGINFDASGIAQSINAMQTSMDVMGIFGENIVGFDKIGYQRKEPVVSSFAEYIGRYALSHSTDEQVGRLTMTEKPLDVALSDKGYFQLLNDDGTIELTRDGRFKINKDAQLTSLEGKKVLSATGLPIVLPFLPESIDKIKIGADGKIGVFDSEKRGLVSSGFIGVVDPSGALMHTNCVRQGYVESSNVSLEKEYIEMANYQRTFEANRQMFKIQNSTLSNVIQTLGRV